MGTGGSGLAFRWLVGLSLVFAACDSSDSPPDSPDPPQTGATGSLDIYSFLKDEADETCDKVTDVICDAPAYYNVPSAYSFCFNNQDQRSVEQAGRYEEAESDGYLTFDEDRADRCVSAWEGSCFDLRETFDGPASCSRVFEGTLAVGQSCSVDQECEGDTYCSGGPDCASSGACTCPGTCEPRLAVGAACHTGHQCASRACSEAKCINTPTAGGVCTPGSLCTIFTACADPDNTGTPRCLFTQAAYVGKVGEACGSGIQYCERYLACAAGVCVQTAAVGQPCGATAPCAETYPCVNGLCQAPAGQGKACTGPNTCAPGLGCFDGKCKNRLGVSSKSTCTNGDQCRSARCEGGVCTYNDTCYF